MGEGEGRVSGAPRPSMVEEVGIVFGLVVVQLVFASYGVALGRLLMMGLDPIALVVYGCLATVVFLSPLAIAFERERWPRRLRPMLVMQFVLIALGGVTSFQLLSLVGIKKTSPAIASAMPNLAPGFIFIIAGCLGLEKINMKCKYGITKIMGTLLCLTGAIAMGLLQGHSPLPPPSSFPGSPPLSSISLQDAVERDRIIGTLCLLIAVLSLSCSMVLQAMIMKEFPAPLSLCTISSFIAFIFTAAFKLAVDGDLGIGLPTMSFGSLILFGSLGGIVNGMCIGFQVWSLKKRGPVLVSMFSPVGTVCSAILSALTLGQPMTISSIVGMILMFGGLYLVLWAKKKEENYGFAIDGVGDSEKPLLT
ncbi:WAT1-related protein [Acorus calamus]|uniref:WAT1-related protein n=1 Tax=Acorus calamus TaxID=4465 RepID=A0AAV9FKR0_ACOCL|nr:WAT1-related protein [Acorus calamus]